MEAIYPELKSLGISAVSAWRIALFDCDLVLVHEWNEPALVARIGDVRRRGARFKLLFHDTHHRAVSEPEAIRHFDLDAYDGVLAFGEALAQVYRRWGWGDRVFVWHEAADIRLFHPPFHEVERSGLVWIGNWGDGERTQELSEFLLEPAEAAGLRLDVHGVRYPAEALRDAGPPRRALPGLAAECRGSAGLRRHLATVHVPRRFYVDALPGIPTIRVFEALACGIPLVCAPWSDAEHLFTPGEDFLVARDGAGMTRHLKALAADPVLRAGLVGHGLATILARHTCAHRMRRTPRYRRVPRRPKPGEVPMEACMKIAFYGSSLLSSYWNGAATYYRGLLKDLAHRGYEVTFYEPDAYDRQKHRDIDPPDWATSVVYHASEQALRLVIAEAAQADIVVKASGVGVFDDELITASCTAARPDALRIFWDVDAPATLAELRGFPHHPLHNALKSLDVVLTYGGGPPVVDAYRSFGARRCVPIYNGLDPSTHHPVRRSSASPATSVFSETASPTGKNASTSSSCAPRQPCRTRPSRSAALAGRTRR